MTALEAINLVKGMEMSDKEKSALIMQLINESKTTKTTVITKQEPQATAKKTAKSDKPVKSDKKTDKKASKSVDFSDLGDIFIIQYSEKSGAILGDTKPLKDLLNEQKLTFNRFLTVPDNKIKAMKKGDKVAGWLFSMKRADDVCEALSEAKIKFTNHLKKAK